MTEKTEEIQLQIHDLTPDKRNRRFTDYFLVRKQENKASFKMKILVQNRVSTDSRAGEKNYRRHLLNISTIFF